MRRAVIAESWTDGPRGGSSEPKKRARISDAEMVSSPGRHSDAQVLTHAEVRAYPHAGCADVLLPLNRCASRAEERCDWRRHVLLLRVARSAFCFKCRSTDLVS